jgi:hypothetical protein
MTEWMTEHWVLEAVLMMVAGFILAKILCVLADFMDRDQ